MVITMKNEKYERIAKDHTAPNPKLKNAVIAFIVGGIIGLIGEGIIELLCMYTHMSRNNAGNDYDCYHDFYCFFINSTRFL